MPKPRRLVVRAARPVIELRVIAHNGHAIVTQGHAGGCIGRDNRKLVARLPSQAAREVQGLLRYIASSEPILGETKASGVAPLS